MAQTPKPAAPGVGQEGLEKQIATLRNEVTKINKMLAERTVGVLHQAREGASDLYDDTSKTAAGAAKQVGTQLQAVSEVARKNPGTTATVLGGVGIVSFLLGVAVGLTLAVTRHRWYT
ncbi:hypothetical protein N181_27000 [Sinorhizobium fredii USDA 205]|uniref:DUF3618 domain-containing protein n=1 Tax=Rhizobium fredii TaxID=380 RepID=A0A844A3F1_RHIFR|nr:hypothetical protein [Sinorhizobium fredii]ASY71885.1 hypothetical protein SF83666_b52360 [Sinorhizobium fredii CCBAU 83666]KSV82895.1 hypothetical protein N181_27000 [Sinorhizobium fredii USDA 205]MQW95578.1 hypothetical protein [Sinorhizobium fredii]MQX07634.1 hypothetical protein [Sinorhizobium fredii]GEC34281.1 hypothetical protein EFR01_44520 [Sinorhizobium fredii]